MLKPILSVAVVAAFSAAAFGQSASDNFDRPNSSTLGPDWVVDNGAIGIEANQAKNNNPWSEGFAHHATFTGNYAQSVQSFDFTMNGFGGAVSIMSGLDPFTWSAVAIKLQDNDGDGLADRVFFNAAVNAGNWNGSSLFYDLATPTASGSMTLSFINNGDTAVVDIVNSSGVTESFQGPGILSFTFPITGTNFAIGGVGSTFIDNWDVTIGGGGPAYAINNLVAGQTATFEVNGVSLGDVVNFGYSLTGAGPTNTVYGAVDMDAPIHFLGAASGDAAGIAALSLPVPANATGRTLYTQALVVSTATLTNSLAQTVL